MKPQRRDGRLCAVSVRIPVELPAGCCRQLFSRHSRWRLLRLTLRRPSPSRHCSPSRFSLTPSSFVYVWRQTTYSNSALRPLENAGQRPYPNNESCLKVSISLAVFICVFQWFYFVNLFFFLCRFWSWLETLPKIWKSNVSPLAIYNSLFAVTKSWTVSSKRPLLEEVSSVLYTVSFLCLLIWWTDTWITMTRCHPPHPQVSHWKEGWASTRPTWRQALSFTSKWISREAEKRLSSLKCGYLVSFLGLGRGPHHRWRAQLLHMQAEFIMTMF